MTMETFEDYYEILQVSPNADRETIERVYRHLAKRYHPDNRATGDQERFQVINRAFHVLDDTTERAAYDAHYTRQQARNRRIVESASDPQAFDFDSGMRVSILKVLYMARKQNVQNSGLGSLELARMVDCPENQMDFYIWYLKGKNLIERTDTGQFAITVNGVDSFLETSGLKERQKMIEARTGGTSQDPA